MAGTSVRAAARCHLRRMIKLQQRAEEFDCKYWLPMKVYELTSWDSRVIDSRSGATVTINKPALIRTD